MPGPQNAITGDDYATDIPVSQVDENELNEEKKAAKYARSHEYKKLKAHWESRIKFYQQYLPDGRPLTEVSPEQRNEMWVVANLVIGELKNAMNYYETSKEIVENDVR
jgi:hypothetical protein